MISSGHIVDGIGFEIVDNMDKSFVLWFSGPGGGTSEVTFGPDEYMTQISGTSGWWNGASMTLITSLKIHTNVCPHGYGPFGAGRDVSNNTPFTSSFLRDHAIVGFSGRVENFLTSISAYTAPV
ncbi:hypothetical protein vseg_008786 [Gypsophila vaccaria]